ncbi:unnamed protein product [Sphagnum jensenii]|uniref:Apple domain-containing protein n=1 Tax=Sphagnum jensenii TaxID=128206 RepID=A0ABP0W3Z4_9BRYO
MGHPHHYNSHHEAAAAAHGTTPRMRCSFKQATAVVCGGNIVVVLYLLHSLLVPLYIRPGASHSSIVLIRQNVMKYTQAQLYRIKEANKARQAAQPLKLIERVSIHSQSISGLDVLFAVENERRRSCTCVSMSIRSSRKRSFLWRCTALLKTAVILCIQPSLYLHKELHQADRLFVSCTHTNNVELVKKFDRSLNWVCISRRKDGIIPGRPLPEECHAEAHTDYDGAAVRWGLTHHVDSAADCCQACLDHARSAEGDSKKCNVWVYCPSEEGCYSPDIYEHKHQECWLKQSDEPKLNFKGRYDEEYRNDHPNAPIVVPWVAGVIR